MVLVSELTLVQNVDVISGSQNFGWKCPFISSLAKKVFILGDIIKLPKGPTLPDIKTMNYTDLRRLNT